MYIAFIEDMSEAVFSLSTYLTGATIEEVMQEFNDNYADVICDGEPRFEMVELFEVHDEVNNVLERIGYYRRMNQAQRDEIIFSQDREFARMRDREVYDYVVTNYKCKI